MKSKPTIAPNKCALCGKQGPLCDSHVVPKFCFEAMVDSKHRMHVVAADSSLERRRYLQDGPKSPLLCSECEGLINERYEKPFKRIWFDNPVYPQPFYDGVMRVQIPDYASFKLFHLSVLWRAGAAAMRERERSVWKNVILHRHEPRLRHLVHAGDPGDENEFPIICYFVVHPNEPERFHPGAFIIPATRRLHGMHGVSLTFAGATWIYFISSHMAREVAPLKFQRDGILPTMRVPITANEDFMQTAAEHFSRHNRRPKPSS